jgi:hypothetical protein
MTETRAKKFRDSELDGFTPGEQRGIRREARRLRFTRGVWRRQLRASWRGVVARVSGHRLDTQ